MTISLYERLGGERGASAIAQRFSTKLQNDPLIAPYVSDLDPEAQVGKQLMFLSWAFGSPTALSHTEVKALHPCLFDDQVTNEQFDAFSGHLAATLIEMGNHGELIDQVMRILGTIRGGAMDR
jgi:truncated hemoglobin YjbI